PKKRIAIIGAGTAGVATLKTFLVDIPEEARQGWEVVVFEQRYGVGGVWLSDSDPLPEPPELPETPLYPELRTNTPHPTMTIPHFTFRPETPLFPRHDAVQQYHADVLSHFNLTSHVRLLSRVVEARWTDGQWEVLVEDRSQERSAELARWEFDHLVVANGHYHYPSEPDIEGLDIWRVREDKQILHSIYFRRGKDFSGRNVLVVGGGSSSRDAARQILPFANSSIYPGIPREQPVPGITYKPAITRFAPAGVEFADGTAAAGVDTVLLATGYAVRVPFLTRGGRLPVLAPAEQAGDDGQLSTCLRYVRPLFRHVFALDAALPPTALAFVGLPVFVANAPSSTAQALLVAHAIADSAVLPSRKAMLADLHAQEERLRAVGYDPAYVGHRLIPLPGSSDTDASAAYQDALVRILQDAGYGGRGAIPPVGTNFTENWRRIGRENGVLLRRGWERVEEGGSRSVQEWVGGVRTEKQWADVMRKLVRWEEEKEKGEG
ncbi:hypothetical protein K488DRAFT_30306, partial [Vararia minispora EC-137]